MHWQPANFGDLAGVSFNNIVAESLIEHREFEGRVLAGVKLLQACDCGVQTQFLKQFDTVRALMKQMMSMSVWQRIKMVTGMTKAGAFNPGNEGMLKTKGNTGHRKSAKERADERKKKKKKR